MARAKLALLNEANEALGRAVIAVQDTQLAILEAQEGCLSQDFQFMQDQEAALVRVQLNIEKYRDQLPQAHSWYRPIPGATRA